MEFLRVLRVGLYERVSTLEQSSKGYSIDAQKDNLEEYCKKNNMKIVDHYTDEGISGTKPPLKRPELQRLLDDVQAGKIDMILFTKLDRWFRSVKEYFKVQEILDKYKVEWKAIHENYDTTTANGQMAITMFLAIAQNERDRTAERIKVVLEHKRKNGEACFGGPSAPFGYKKEPDENGVVRLVKDPETKDAVQDFWNILIESKNLNKAIRQMHEVYGIEKGWNTWSKISKSEFYCGMHRGIMDFCPAYVSPENFLKYIESRPIKSTPTGRVYIFSGLMRCPECNYKLGGGATKQKYGTYKLYRCVNRCKSCTFKKAVFEKKMEKHMMANIKKYMTDAIKLEELRQANPRPKPKNNVKALKEKLRRLNVMYMAGGKTDEEYVAETKALNAALTRAENNVIENTGPNIKYLKEVLNSDFETLYKTFDDEEKQEFWTRLIKEIKLDNNKVKEVIFF
jgi:DNA invertase Pin-like site-specific DNA recombinase